MTRDFTFSKYTNFKIPFLVKNSESVPFLKDLYTYPPKFKIIWEQLDDLNQDLAFHSRSSSSPGRKSFSLFREKSYSFNDYTFGYLNRTTSSTFYGKHTNAITNSLQSIPVYIVMNGKNEIVTANSSLSYRFDDSNSKMYDFCGSFDPRFNKSAKLGLIFFNHLDAEFYLNEIAKLDPPGTDEVGLSVHCIGLNSAYALSREYHSDIDFRFVPNFTEINNVIELGRNDDSRFVFDINQQQLRFRNRTLKFPINVIPGFRTVENYVSPFKTFITGSEYFKGVPIYLVQVQNTSRNFAISSILNSFSFVESTYEFTTRWIDMLSGFGQSWLLQSDSNKVMNSVESNTVVNYVCFNKQQAIDLTKKFGSRVIRYNGTRVQTSFLSKFSRTPKIYISNFEDFLELWDESILSSSTVNNGQSIFNGNQSIYFIPSEDSVKNLEEFSKISKKPFVTVAQQFLYVKYKVLVGFFGALLNNN